MHSSKQCNFNSEAGHKENTASCHCNNFLIYIMYSTNNDCIASHHNTIQKTPTCTYTTQCGRTGCSTVFVYDNVTDWPTVNCLVDDHYQVCTGRFYEPAPSRPPADTHSSQHAPSPAQLGPESWGVNNSNRDNDVIAG